KISQGCRSEPHTQQGWPDGHTWGSASPCAHESKSTNFAGFTTTINFEEFTRLMNLMNFSYIGPNGSGDMISNKSILDVEVNTIGKSSTKFTLDYLINNNYLQFYYNNNTSTKLNNFNWNQVKDENGHWLTSPGTLSNGDIVKITYKDPTMSAAYEYYAPIVSGLKEKVDNMAMFTWIGIGVATLVTLGIFALIYLHSTKKKLK
ncbi:MAG: hypothetical protein IJ970_01440, partial [Mycoplasmataceae bacterium]|nr:hypothetical protein [Mycoplasmataceae bacterium]